MTGPWYVECFSCGGRFVDYFAEAPPFADTLQAPEVMAGLLRHTDGRIVQMDEPYKCDSCGIVCYDFYASDGLTVLHPSRFRRSPE